MRGAHMCTCTRRYTHVHLLVYDTFIKTSIELCIYSRRLVLFFLYR